MIFSRFWKFITNNMSNLLINKIIAKLGKLDEYIKYLREIQKVNKKTFTSDYHFYGLAERYLQLSIEVLFDIGKLLVVANGLRRPEDNQDIFSILGEEKILTAKIVEKFAGMANFRNILVHDYEKIDREIIYMKLHDNLADFGDFIKAVKKFLGK